MISVTCTIALVNVTIYTFYFTKACVKSDYYVEVIDDEFKHWPEYEDEIGKPLLRFTWISFLLLCIIFFTAGCVMLNRLRLYFVDFYKESGCKLWTANILLTLPLTFRAVFDGLGINSSWSNFWLENSSRVAGYNLILIFFATYIPMLL